jgi:hypothetical protein
MVVLGRWVDVLRDRRYSLLVLGAFVLFSPGPARNEAASASRRLQDDDDDDDDNDGRRGAGRDWRSAKPRTGSSRRENKRWMDAPATTMLDGSPNGRDTTRLRGREGASAAAEELLQQNDVRCRRRAKDRFEALVHRKGAAGRMSVGRSVGRGGRSVEAAGLMTAAETAKHLTFLATTYVRAQCDPSAYGD